MPVLDAKALDADPEGAALLRSVLDAGLKRGAVQRKKKQRKGEEQSEIPDGQTASVPSQQALAKVRELVGSAES